MTNQEDNMISLLKTILPTIDELSIKEFFEERAAIREYDGGMDRYNAEMKAFEDTVEYFGIINHITETTKSA